MLFKLGLLMVLATSALSATGIRSKVIIIGDWFSQFHNCYINLILLEPKVEVVGRFETPLTISNLEAGQEISEVTNNFAGRNTFCEVQVTVLTTYETLTILKGDEEYFEQQETDVMVAYKRFKGSLCSGRPFDDVAKASRCLFVMLGLEAGTWEKFKVKVFAADWNFDVPWTPLNVFRLNTKEMEHYVIFAQPTDESKKDELVLSGGEFLCTVCNYSAGIEFRKLDDVKRLKATLPRKWRGVLPVLSDPNQTGNWFPLLIFVQSPSDPFSFLKKLQFRAYVRRYRKIIPLSAILAAILYEVVDPELAEDLKTFQGGLVPPQISFVSSVILQNGAASGSIYTTGKDSMNFVTCHGLRGSAELGSYLTSFDVVTWALVLLVVFFCSLLSLGTLSKWRSLGTHCFYNSAVLVENGSVGDGERSKVLRLTVLSLISVVLGSAFKGVVTRDVISPLGLRIPFERMDQLRNFTFASLPLEEYRGDDWLKEALKHPEGRRAYAAFSDLGSRTFSSPDTDSAYWTDHVSEREGCIYDRSFITTSNEEVFEYIRDCERRAFVGLPEDLGKFMESRNDMEERFVYGKDEFMPANHFLLIPNAAGSFFHLRMAQIISSGIYGKWEESKSWKSREELPLHLKKTAVRRQSLNTNLIVIFRLSGMGLCLALAVFCMELICTCRCRRISLRFKSKVGRGINGLLN